MFKDRKRTEISCYSLLGYFTRCKYHVPSFYRRLLLERGADETRKCRLGQTPLQVSQKDSEGAKLLVRFLSSTLQIASI